MAVVNYRLCGEIDVANAAQLRSELSALINDGAANLVIDCAHLGFIDSVGVTVLLEAHQRLSSDGRQLSIVHVSGGPLRILEGLGLADLLRLEGGGEAGERDRESTDHSGAAGRGVDGRD